MNLFIDESPTGPTWRCVNPVAGARGIDAYRRYEIVAPTGQRLALPLRKSTPIKQGYMAVSQVDGGRIVTYGGTVRATGMRNATLANGVCSDVDWMPTAGRYALLTHRSRALQAGTGHAHVLDLGTDQRHGYTVLGVIHGAYGKLVQNMPVVLAKGGKRSGPDAYLGFIAQMHAGDMIVLRARVDGAETVKIYRCSRGHERALLEIVEGTTESEAHTKLSRLRPMVRALGETLSNAA